MNFAISEGTARAFVDANNVPYEVEPSDKPLPSADIAAMADISECDPSKASATLGCFRSDHQNRSRRRSASSMRSSKVGSP